VITDVVLLHLFVAGFNLSNSCTVGICLTLILGRWLLARAHESELFRLEFAIFSCCKKKKIFQPTAPFLHYSLSLLFSWLIVWILGWGDGGGKKGQKGLF
jgi:hypothetical protein